MIRKPKDYTFTIKSEIQQYLAETEVDETEKKDEEREVKEGSEDEFEDVKTVEEIDAKREEKEEKEEKTDKKISSISVDYIQATNEIIEDINNAVQSSLTQEMQSRIQQDLKEINDQYDKRRNLLISTENARIEEIRNIFSQQRQNVEFERQTHISEYHKEIHDRVSHILKALSEKDQATDLIGTIISKIKSVIY